MTDTFLGDFGTAPNSVFAAALGIRDAEHPGRIACLHRLLGVGGVANTTNVIRNCEMNDRIIN